MNWLARLKKIETAPERDATEPTKPGFVGFVASDMAPVQKTGGDTPAANDSTPDPDRWCWPHSDAMNTGEIDTLTGRLARFTDKGLELDGAELLAELLADKLVKRDRDLDDRRMCLECAHLAGEKSRVWGCANARRAGLAAISQIAPLAAALVHQLQRCDGFSSSP